MARSLVNYIQIKNVIGDELLQMTQNVASVCLDAT